jgi:DNA-binding FadR family transcriptional regulator
MQYEFHRLIAQATYNPIFVLTVDYLMDFIFDFRKSMFTPDINLCTKVVSDHRGIFTSLKESNGVEAEEKMLAHLKYLEEYQMNEGL